LKPISSHFKGKKPIQAAFKEVLRFADVEHEPAGIKVEFESQVSVYVWDGAEWEEKIKKLVKVAPDQRLGV
jgi:hypothetical protein